MTRFRALPGERHDEGALRLLRVWERRRKAAVAVVFLLWLVIAWRLFFWPQFQEWRAIGAPTDFGRLPMQVAQFVLVTTPAVVTGWLVSTLVSLRAESRVFEYQHQRSREAATAAAAVAATGKGSARE